MSQCGIQVPSFISSKDFKLPGLTPPTIVTEFSGGSVFCLQCLTTSGIPYLISEEVPWKIHVWSRELPVIPTGFDYCLQ